MDALVVKDWQYLLIKYIRHVVDQEGIDYLDQCTTDPGLDSAVLFTAQEVDLLRQLSQAGQAQPAPKPV